MIVEFDGEVFRWEARTDIEMMLTSLPEDLGAVIREIPRPPRGFGSVRVRASVGEYEWKTSIFPDSRRSYVLPLKKAVRDSADLVEGGPVHVRLEVLDA